MRIWIDLANSPHVPFFRALAAEFTRRSHEVTFTARRFAETVALAQAAALNPVIIGGYGGRQLAGKAGNLLSRGWALARWARKRQFELTVSHNSYSQILAARALWLKSVTLMDYEHQPANHLAFRLASRVVVPRSFPAESLDRYGARATKVMRYNGIKEDVYLADFEPDTNFERQLLVLGIERGDVLVVARPPADDALYHRFENVLFDAMLETLCERPAAKVVLLPRNSGQREKYAARGHARLILPVRPLDGANLIALSDLVVSAGGTMNREAAALGVPAVTIYAGKLAAVDEELIGEGRLRRIRTREELETLPVVKKDRTNQRRAMHVRAEVADLILQP